MRCGRCLNEWSVDDEWVDRFDQGEEPCPRCGIDCQDEDRPRFWARPGDLSNDDSFVRSAYWFHTSTHADWPSVDFDPASGFTEETKRRMRALDSDGRALERWTQRQRTKALHLGTYEAAIENMLRRMRSQDNAHDHFHLYRVQLRHHVAIEPGVHKEQTNIAGDMQLDEVCSPGSAVYRYVNVHEDPSSISLAVSIGAIRAVQQIPVPLPVDPSDPWVASATAKLVRAAAEPNRPPESGLDRNRGWTTSSFSNVVREIEIEAAAGLPFRLRGRLHSRVDKTRFDADTTAYPVNLAGLVKLVNAPQTAITALGPQPWRTL